LSDEARATRAAIARLRAEILADREALGTRVEHANAILQRWSSEPPEEPYLAFAAVTLHAWYTGLETLLERVARQIDCEVPAGDASHRSLLSQAMTEIEGLRPAVLSRALERDLVELLSFRHFFRHAYAVELDPEKLRPLLHRLESLAPRVDAQLDAFDAFLAAAAATAAAN